MEAWVCFADSDSIRCEDKVVHALDRAGIRVSPLNTSSPCGPVLLFFSKVTPTLYERLWKMSDAGRERVLAVAFLKPAPYDYDAWRVLQGGASDVLVWNQTAESPAAAIAARLERWRMVDDLLQSRLVRGNLIGKSTAWLTVLRQIVEVSRFTAADALILGESGTGKELVARLIHTLDPRPQKGDLVIADCTTTVPELSGSEFFGHERGAFTGAANARDGAFALANKGTLFLDEVGELPLPLQAQLLRVVQEHTYKRVGGNSWQRTEFRLVCATNKNLLDEVKRGNFRQDLYYRIANWIFTLPPLRERLDDIIPLADYFIKQYGSQENSPLLDDAVKDYLIKREYSGNVRDLKQVIARIMHKHVGQGCITVGDIPVEERPLGKTDHTEWRKSTFENAIRFALSHGATIKDIRREAEETAIRVAVNEENGNLQRAARKLGVTDRALQLRRAAERQIQDRISEARVAQIPQDP